MRRGALFNGIQRVMGQVLHEEGLVWRREGLQNVHMPLWGISLR